MEKLLIAKNGVALYKDESGRLIMRRKDGAFIKIVSSVFAVNELCELFPNL